MCKALTAINRAVFARLERNRSFLATGGAYRCVHFTLRLCGVFAVLAAGFASLRLVLEALRGVKLLLAGSEYKFLAAILADESLVFVHVDLTSLRT